MNYDEDINKNIFFIQLKTHFFDLIEKSTEQKWVICVPKSCVNIPKLTEKDFRDHILINEKEKNQNTYSTLNGQKVKVKNGKIIVRNYENSEINFNDSENVLDDKKVLNQSVFKKESVSVRILFEETFYMDDLKSYQIWCIDNFLNQNQNQNILNVTSDFINEINSLNDASNFLFQTFQENDILTKINSEIQNFLYQTSKLQNEISIIKLKSLVQNFYVKCILNFATETVDSNIKISLETYIQNSVHKFVFGVILTNLYIEDSNFNKIVKNFKEIQIRQLDIKVDITDSIFAAKQCLSKINNYSTFIDKVDCLKKTFIEINQSKIITSDELLSIFVFLILKSNVPNWESNLMYLKEFRIENNNDVALDDFLIATLEAAIEYIKSGNFNTENKIDSKVLENTNRKSDFSSEMDAFKTRKNLKFVGTNEHFDYKNENDVSVNKYVCGSKNKIIGAESNDLGNKCPNFELKNHIFESNSNHVLKAESTTFWDKNHVSRASNQMFGRNQIDSEIENKNFETQFNISGNNDFSKNYISEAKNKNKNLLTPEKIANNSTGVVGGKERKSFIIKTENNLNNTNNATLFECIANGNDFKLKSLLKNIDFSDEKIESESKMELCHPLCCCEKCENAFESKNGSIFMRNEEGQTLLHYACLFGQLKIVEIILSRGGHKLINSKDFKNQTPLHYASCKGYHDIFLLLLDKGAIPNQVDNEKNSPLHLAGLNGHLGIVKTILFSRNNENFDINACNCAGDTALHHGARWGYYEICQILIENGAKLIRNNLGKTPLDLALNSKIYQILSSKNFRNAEMAIKSKLGSNSKYVDILEPKNDLTFRNFDNTVSNQNDSVMFDFLDDFRTAETLRKEKQKRKAELLLKAVTYDDIPLICFYLGLPLSKTINERNNCHPLCDCQNCQTFNGDGNSISNQDRLDINLSDSNGFTALHMASLHGQVDIVKLLLANSANVNLTTKKFQSPLHLAAQTDRVEIVRLLTEIEQDCKIDLQDYKGNTPLHLACVARNLEIVKILISKGADLNIQNSNGEKPIDVVGEGKVLEFLNNFIRNEE